MGDPPVARLLYRKFSGKHLLPKTSKWVLLRQPQPGYCMRYDFEAVLGYRRVCLSGLRPLIDFHYKIEEA